MRTPIEHEQDRRALPPAIAASWARCKARGVDTGRPPLPPRIDEHELASRLARCEPLVAAARPHLEWLNGYFADIRHVVYLTDATGVVLASYGDEAYQEAFGLLPGYRWSEDVMGTNGAGTALASEAPIAVVGSEHYVAAFRDCTCVAAPIRDQAGVVIGAIDLSAAPPDLSADRLDLMSYVARMIQRDFVAFAVRPDESTPRSDAGSEGLGTEDFLAMLAHELRNHLGTLLHAARVSATCGPDVSTSMARIIERQGLGMARIIEDLLDLARVRQGKLALAAQDLDLRDVVGAAIADVGVALGERNRRITFESPAQPAVVHGDRERLEQVFVNLLGNAAKYTHEGGRIHVSIAVDPEWVIVQVRDDGIGILPDVLPHVFELYVRGPRAVTRARRGLGIGLALVKMIVALHGGHVEARSDGAGKGSVLIVRVPRATPA